MPWLTPGRADPGQGEARPGAEGKMGSHRDSAGWGQPPHATFHPGLPTRKSRRPGQIFPGKVETDFKG